MRNVERPGCIAKDGEARVLRLLRMEGHAALMIMEHTYALLCCCGGGGSFSTVHPWIWRRRRARLASDSEARCIQPNSIYS